MSVWYRMPVLSDSASKYEIAVSSSQIVTWRVSRLAYGFRLAFEKSYSVLIASFFKCPWAHHQRLLDDHTGVAIQHRNRLLARV
jgi:hypothetical protein